MTDEGGRVRGKEEECSCQQNQMASKQQQAKIQLKCGVKRAFEVGHGA